MMWISFCIIFGYLAFVLAKFGISRSISDTYYLLGKKGWLFQLALAATAFTAMPMLIDNSSENTRFLAFIACAGLTFVSCAPMFKLELEGKVHYISAYTCCICLVLWQVFNTSWLVPFVCFMLVIMPIKKDGKKTWWMEIATIVSTYASLIIFY